MATEPLSEYFSGVFAKVLSEVEANRAASHQHEFNGTGELRALLGEPDKHTYFGARLLYLDDTDVALVPETCRVTWYDARRSHPRRTAWRLYFPDTAVTDRARAGDVLVVALQNDGSLLIVIAEGDSSIASPILWLFGIKDLETRGFALRRSSDLREDKLGFARQVILDSVGIETSIEGDSALDQLIERFGDQFPPTREFSRFACDRVGAIDIAADPDAALMEWIREEESLFRQFERHLATERLARGFCDDIDDFLAFSLSVQNRRKSRMGHALENHLEALFNGLGITFARNAVTEANKRPDFLFPNLVADRNPAFPVNRLTMLAAKSTCKDRWRQILTEADRIGGKHLITLESAISLNQTSEMQEALVQLIVPSTIQESYRVQQREWLLNVAGFVSIVRSRQKDIPRISL